MPDRAHVGVYGEVNANLVDGSSVWLQSVCLTLASVPDVRVSVLLRAPMERDLLVRPLADHPRIEVVDPRRWQPGGMLTPLGAVAALSDLDDHDRFDHVVLRGSAVCEAAAGHGRFDGRIWLYHVPVEGVGAEQIADWGSGAHRILCQTEAIRDQVRAAAPELTDRTLILPPMIPRAAETVSRPDGSIRRLLYAGKISPEYFAMEMVELLERLREEIPEVELHVAGDKIHNPPEEPDFRARATAALEETEGLVWHGAVSRDEVAELLREADVALSIRDARLDESAEMSTKVLEYGAAGCPVLLNPTDLHVEQLGPDYPLFATNVEEAVASLLRASSAPEERREAGRRVRELSLGHTYENVAAGLAPHISAKFPAGPGPPPQAGRRTGLLVAGHNLSFTSPILDLARRRGWDPEVDLWQDHTTADEVESEAALSRASTVFCEWCLGNAAWYSHHKRAGQTLVVRFHRMELETEYPAEVDLERIDTMVFVAQHVLEAACERFGWQPDDPRFTIVPNAIDTARLELEKLPGTEFTLGMIGYVPRVKRLDRALDVLDRLRIHDDRYRMIVKGRGPWEYPWMSAREDERRYYRDLFERIDRAPRLRQAVLFESFGDDVPEFLQQVGWILSTSEIEGHSVALAEGMASGAVPALLDRPGAGLQYEADWVHPDPDAVVRAILSCQARGGTPAEAESARRFAARWSLDRIEPVWDRLLGLSDTR